jgi:pilus assembly protein CpaE
MTPPIRTLVAVDAALDPEVVERILGDPGIDIVSVISSDDVKGRSQTRVDVLLLACSGESDDALRLIGDAVRERPDRPVVVACGGSPNGFVRQVFAAGADDIVLFEESNSPGPDTFFALQKAVARKSGTGPADDQAGSLISVLGPKGGIGKTLTAANLAASLAQGGHRVAVVDLDLQFGDLGLALGLQPERTIYDLARSGGSLDSQKVDAYLADHLSGARVLLAPVRPDQAQTITVDFLKEVYGLLRSMFDFVVVDTPPNFTPEVIVSVDASTSICMVGMLDAPSLKNTKLGLETLELMGYPSDRVRVVLNRADTNVGISHADVVAVLGRAPDVLVPSQRDVVRSINAGEPIVMMAKRSEPAKAFRALAELFMNERATAGPRQRAGRGLRLLGRA